MEIQATYIHLIRPTLCEQNVLLIYTYSELIHKKEYMVQLQLKYNLSDFFHMKYPEQASPNGGKEN